MNWHVAMRPSKRKTLDLNSELARKLDKVEQIKASIRVKVEHPSGSSNCSSATQGSATRITVASVCVPTAGSGSPASCQPSLARKARPEE